MQLQTAESAAAARGAIYANAKIAANSLDPVDLERVAKSLARQLHLESSERQRWMPFAVECHSMGARGSVVYVLTLVSRCVLDGVRLGATTRNLLHELLKCRLGELEEQCAKDLLGDRPAKDSAAIVQFAARRPSDRKEGAQHEQLHCDYVMQWDRFPGEHPRPFNVGALLLVFLFLGFAADEAADDSFLFLALGGYLRYDWHAKVVFLSSRPVLAPTPGLVQNASGTFAYTAFVCISKDPRARYNVAWHRETWDVTSINIKCDYLTVAAKDLPVPEKRTRRR